MRGGSGSFFATVRAEGGLFPSDLLVRIASGDGNLGGFDPAAYHLVAPGERVTEAISRAWTRLLPAWNSFRQAREKLSPGDLGTGLTRDRWLLLFFQELGYGRLAACKALTVTGKSYPISHFWQKVPIHLIGFGVDLDQRQPGVAGAARISPHGLVQELLNRSEDHLWGIVSNGLRLRLLRDNASLTRQACVEFDLETMMAEEVYADFALLWLLCHESRLGGDSPQECWLERWVQAAYEQGIRALETLRSGVEDAICVLGTGFLGHPANTLLRDRLRSGALFKEDYYRQLLRLVYRLIFLFVAEERGLLADPQRGVLERDRYVRYYSATRLRRLAESQRGTAHPDLYRSLRIVMEKLSGDEGCPPLALPALGSSLWSPQATPDLSSGELSNRDLLTAVRALTLVKQDHLQRPVDFKNLGTEEFGSVYESLLELHPDVNTDARTFGFSAESGLERKTTGSYYTSASLIRCLLDSALEPVLEEAARQSDPQRAILGLRVCDPACGSGHFLVAAAHRIARRLAQIRTGDEEPSPAALRPALREVISHCIHGVDQNPMAVELCKIGLWMEAIEPGKPLSFLDHHILCGNSLIGATPALLKQGIPDEAFQQIEGDDKQTCSSLRRQNRDERRGQATLFSAMAVAEPKAAYTTLSHQSETLEALPEDSIGGVRAKEAQFCRLTESPEYRKARLVADAWCAAFMWKKAAGAPPPITHAVFLELQKDPDSIPPAVQEEIVRLAGQYRFFHWHLAFPEVFRVPAEGKPENARAGWSGGFDVVLGNPPWEHTELKEKEWFSTRYPDIANAPTGAARKRKIEELEEHAPALYKEFLEARRYADGMAHFAGNSGRYPLCGRGRINTYAIFAETKRTLISSSGRVGAIVPTGIATDDTTKFFFQDLVGSRSLVSLYDFENREKLFPAVHSRMKFCLLTLTGRGRPTTDGAEFAFFLHRVEDLGEQDRRFTLTAEEIALLNPNTRTCPIFRTKRDAEITKAIYRRVPVLIKEGPPEENPWGVSFSQGLFNMTSDSHLFRTRDQLIAEDWRLEGNVFHKGDSRYLPLYEAKMSQIYNHRAADVVVSARARQRRAQPDTLDSSELVNPDRVVMPLYWVKEHECNQAVAGKWNRQWLLGFTNVTSPTNERTMNPGLFPWAGVGHSMPVVLGTEDAKDFGLLYANLCAFIFDYVVRQKIGGVNLSFFLVNQFPVLPPAIYGEACAWAVTESVRSWVAQRVLELTFTAWDLKPFANDLGYGSPPFRWDDERRFLLRCELDAAFFHLYGISQEDADYILDTFPIVREKDEERFGEYRTKRVILERYDAMQRAISDGKPYQTVLDPPPADPRLCHLARGTTKQEIMMK